MVKARGTSRRAVMAGAAAVALLPGVGRAQAWPSRTITLVVPFAPGGGTDTFARPFAAKLSQQIGQQVVVDNRAGAGGTVGAALVAKAKPDGYTVLLGSVHHSVAVSAYKKLSYELEKDLAPVTSVASVPDVLVIYPEVPAKTLQEFIAYCKANAGKVNYGSAGLGTTRHLAGEIFNAKTGTAMTHVPYKGTGPATAALISGEVAAVFEGLGSAAPYIRSGKARALAVFSAERSPAFPDIPTAAEAGLPGFESLSWYGLWVPAGTDPGIIAKLQADVAKCFDSADLKKIWLEQGASPGGALRRLREGGDRQVGQGRSRQQHHS
ncbi:MAG: tripartite tricarboxylate transporter substrate binding protein [Reyranella sp.]|nr:tripartite tricarboxylate transporter substrate binding protein [Reyranella sp.]MDP3163449.1 tripartite tricarboxylate transporter substrate binding protein [Reyranella sp.]